MQEGLTVFTIKDLESLSGIKAHTIRIWEKRYNILEPDRTDSNIRTYNEAELKKILNVSYLNRNGIKISKIAKLNEDQLTQKVITVSSLNDSTDSEFQPGKVLMSALRFNESGFKDTLTRLVQVHGVEKAYCSYLYPLVEKAKILWQTGSLSRAQEQFIINSIRQIIIIEDNYLKNGKASSTVAMINSSAGVADNNFLFYKYALKKRGFDVIFTGGVLPLSETIEIHKVRSFEYLIVNMNQYNLDNKQTSYFSSLIKSLKIKKVIFTDVTESDDIKKDDKIVLTKEPSHFLEVINSITL